MKRLAGLMLILATAASAQLTRSLAFIQSVNNYGQVDTGLPQLAGATNYTLEMWVRPTGLGADGSNTTNHRVFSFIDGSSEWQLGFQDQTFYLDLMNETIVWSGSEITNDVWQHIAVVVEDTVAIVYINAAYSSHSLNGAPIPGTISTFYVGAWSPDLADLPRQFAGNMDEIRIWNRALSHEELYRLSRAPLTGSETGLVAYWDMEAIIGGKVLDGSPNGNDLTVVGLNLEDEWEFGYDSDATVFTALPDHPLSNDNGASAGQAWGDYNNDGLLDLFIANGMFGTPEHFNQLFMNLGGGNFIENSSTIISDLDADEIDRSFSGSWGDFDNDGDLDLAVGEAEAFPSIYLNDGAGNFVLLTGDDMTGGATNNYAGGHARITTGDLNGDGNLDLYVTSGFGPNYLFFGVGDGTFTQVSRDVLTTEFSHTEMAAMVDLNNDGYLDIYVANTPGDTETTGKDWLFHNNGDGTFTQVTDIAPVMAAKISTGVDFFDIDNDQDLDILISKGWDIDKSPSRLYIQNSDGTFTERLSGPLVEMAVTIAGSAVGDFDNDGDLDVLVLKANYDDFGANLFENDGNGNFTMNGALSLISHSSLHLPTEQAVYRNPAWIDYDGDGDLDLYALVNGDYDAGLDGFLPQNNRLFENQGNDNHWLEVRLIGTASNRSGIGAKVRIFSSPQQTGTYWQTRVISGQNGQGTQTDLTVHFGLGVEVNVQRLEVTWPSGTVQELLNVAADQVLTLTEPGGKSIAATRESVGGLTFAPDSSTYLEIDNLLGTLISGGKRTIEVWTRIETMEQDSDRWHTILTAAYADGTGLVLGYHGRQSAFTPAWHFTTATASDIGVWPPGPIDSTLISRWVHMAVTFDGNQALFYFNGVPGGPTTVTGDLENITSPLYVGSNTNESGFGGVISDLRIWNIVKTEDQIRQQMYAELTGSESGLIGYWPMNEATGDTAYDLSVNANHGILKGAQWLTTAEVNALTTGQFDFPAISLGLTLNSLSGPTTITVSELNTVPPGSLPLEMTAIGETYWLISLETGKMIDADITFIAAPGTFDADQIATPATVRLLHRNQSGSSPWEVTTTASVVTDSSATFLGITDFSQFAMAIDVTAPTISTIVLPATISATAAIQVAADISDISALVSTKLFYAAGGESAYSQQFMTLQSGVTFTASIPGTAVSPKGLLYYIEATDASGNVQTFSPVNLGVSYEAGTVTTAISNSEYPGGVASEAWSLISVPTVPNDWTAQSIFGNSVQVEASDETWGLFEFVGPAVDNYQSVTTLESGKSYFFKHVTGSSVEINVGIGASTPLVDQSVTLKGARWNFIGNPFAFNTTIDIASNGSVSSAAQYGPFGSEGQEGWLGSQTSVVIQPFGGALLYNVSSASIPFTITPSIPDLSKSVELFEGWIAQLSVEDRTSFDGLNFVGQRVGAKSGIDRFEITEPPAITSSIALTTALEGDQQWTSDIRPIGSTEIVWELLIHPQNVGDEVTMAWTVDGQSTPEAIMLVDPNSGTVTDMAEITGITFRTLASRHRLLLIAGDRDDVEREIAQELALLPLSFALRQNYPNPFNPATTITYELPLTGQVDITVYDLMGREIVKLTHGVVEAGYHQTVWNGRDGSGRSVPSGVYFLRLLTPAYSKSIKMVVLK